MFERHGYRHGIASENQIKSNKINAILRKSVRNPPRAAFTSLTAGVKLRQECSTSGIVMIKSVVAQIIA